VHRQATAWMEDSDVHDDGSGDSRGGRPRGAEAGAASDPFAETRRGVDPGPGVRAQPVRVVYPPGAFAWGALSTRPGHRGGGHGRGRARWRIQQGRQGCHCDGRHGATVRRQLCRIYVRAVDPGAEDRQQPAVGCTRRDARDAADCMGFAVQGTFARARGALAGAGAARPRWGLPLRPSRSRTGRS